MLGLCFDLVFLAGVGLVGIGLWWAWPPAALIWSGAVLVTLGIWGARRWGS